MVDDAYGAASTLNAVAYICVIFRMIRSGDDGDVGIAADSQRSVDDRNTTGVSMLWAVDFNQERAAGDSICRDESIALAFYALAVRMFFRDDSDIVFADELDGHFLSGMYIYIAGVVAF